LAKLGSTTSFLSSLVIESSDSCGNWIRIKAFPNGEGTGIDLDRDKNLYVVGGFLNKLKLCGAHVDACGINIFVAKIDRNWRTEWVVTTRYDSESFSSAINIVVDNDNNSYIDGPFDQPISFNRKTLVPKGSIDEFVAKVSPDGSWSSSIQISGAENTSSSKNIAVNNSDELYVTGSFGSKLVIDHMSEFGPTTSLFLAKIKNRLPKLIGIISDKCKDSVFVVFNGHVKLHDRDRLDPGRDYYVDYEGYITPCSKYKYLGTAISENTLYIH